MGHNEIERLVLNALTNANLAREATQQLLVSPTASIFGADSPLDSLGLVALLIDIEEALYDNGHSIQLSDAKAMSQRHSPFRNVPALVSYIETELAAVS